mmetsp:Transcript_17731/g.36818  ORF Transcript_17731/g.36818 Transcript_17731/m.36818 type:complete len:196 (+) Transcript_17731:370-957(+)
MIDAFSNFDNLHKVTAKDVLSVGEAAFCYCSMLKEVEIPSATRIEQNAFFGCQLTKCDCSNLEIIGNKAFSCCYLSSDVNFPNVRIIGEFAFANGYALEYIHFPEVEVIGTSAFFEYKQLYEANFPKATKVMALVFRDCESLTKIHLPNVYRIENSAFKNCALIEVNLPNVTELGVDTFFPTMPSGSPSCRRDGS